MKPDTITIPFTLTFDPAGQELAELARHIVTRLTDEGALDEAAEHGHGIMATSAAIEWARERLGNQIPAVPEPAPNAGASALYGPGETLEQAVIDATRHPDEVEDEAAVDAFFEALGTDGGGIVEGSDEYNSIVFAAITDPAGTIASLDPEAEPPADDAPPIWEANDGRRMIRTPQAIARDDGLIVDAGQGFE